MKQTRIQQEAERLCTDTAEVVRVTGRGSYQLTRLDRYGFPRGYLMRRKQIHCFQTGDRVQAQVPNGKKAGIYQGRVAIRASGCFNIQTAQGVIQGIAHRHCRRLQRADDSGYSFQPETITEDARPANRAMCGARCAIPPHPEGRGFSRKLMNIRFPAVVVVARICHG